MNEGAEAKAGRSSDQRCIVSAAWLRWRGKTIGNLGCGLICCFEHRPSGRSVIMQWVRTASSVRQCWIDILAIEGPTWIVNFENPFLAKANSLQLGRMVFGSQPPPAAQRRSSDPPSDEGPLSWHATARLAPAANDCLPRSISLATHCSRLDLAILAREVAGSTSRSLEHDWLWSQGRVHAS